jgi:hypothetical protein
MGEQRTPANVRRCNSLYTLSAQRRQLFRTNVRSVLDEGTESCSAASSASMSHALSRWHAEHVSVVGKEARHTSTRRHDTNTLQHTQKYMHTPGTREHARITRTPT